MVHRCNTTHYDIKKCNKLQHAATHCIALQHTWRPDTRYIGISKLTCVLSNMLVNAVLFHFQRKGHWSWMVYMQYTLASPKWPTHTRTPSHTYAQCLSYALYLYTYIKTHVHTHTHTHTRARRKGGLSKTNAICHIELVHLKLIKYRYNEYNILLVRNLNWKLPLGCQLQ